MQQLLLQTCTAVINIANNCLEADNSKKIVESRALVTKATDAITIMGNCIPCSPMREKQD